MSKTNDSFPLPDLIKSEIIFEESLFKIRRDRLRVNKNPPYSYYTLMTFPFAVAILASTPEGAYILNEEYRHPTGNILLGCPGGYVDPGEEILQAAKRELLEETGYQAESFHIIGSAFPYAGFTGQKTIYARAYNATLAKQPELETSEVIRSRLLTPKELHQLIQSNIEVDGVLCTALFFNQCQQSQSFNSN